MSLVIVVLLMEAYLWFIANREMEEPIQRSINLYWTTVSCTFLSATMVIGYKLADIQPLYNMTPFYTFCVINLTVALSISTLMKHRPAR